MAMFDVLDRQLEKGKSGRRAVNRKGGGERWSSGPLAPVGSSGGLVQLEAIDKVNRRASDGGQSIVQGDEAAAANKLLDPTQWTLY